MSDELDNTAQEDLLLGLEVRMNQEEKALHVDFGALKSGGYIKQRQRDLFTIRLRCPAGRINTAKLKKIAEVADKYGQGWVHTSVRQSIEIPYVHIKDFDAVKAELAEVDLLVASCGPRVRVPTACAGCEYNPNGIIDSQKLCLETDKLYFGRDTHHKFKIVFSGCPIDCTRAKNADLGFAGMVKPLLIEELCTSCELCCKACKDDALHMDGALPVRDETKCTDCGDCIKACPFDAMVKERIGCAIYVGGKHGKHPRPTDKVAVFVPESKALDVVERVVDWYVENGKRGERLGHTIDRVGLDHLKESVFTGELKEYVI